MVVGSSHYGKDGIEFLEELHSVRYQADVPVSEADQPQLSEIWTSASDNRGHFTHEIKPHGQAKVVCRWRNRLSSFVKSDGRTKLVGRYYKEQKDVYSTQDDDCAGRKRGKSNTVR